MNTGYTNSPKKNKVKKKFSERKSVKIVASLLVCVFVLGFGASKYSEFVYSQPSNDYGYDYIQSNNSLVNQYMGAADTEMAMSSRPSIVEGIGDMLSGGMKSEVSAPMEMAPVSSSDYESNFSGDNTDNSGTDGEKNSKSEKLVYSSNIDLETKEIKEALSYLHSLVSEYGAIIQSEELNNMNSVDKQDAISEGRHYYSGNANARLYVRVPQAKYNDFITGLNNEDSPIVLSNISQDIDNMTDIYYDYEARLKSLRIQESRLQDFMANANTVADMLEVENRLTDVQYEIDSIVNSLNTIDNDVDYAKVQIYLREVVKYTPTTETPRNFFERLVEYFKGSGSSFLETMEDWLAVAIFLLPYALIVVVIVIIVKKVRKGKKRKEEEKLHEQVKEREDMIFVEEKSKEEEKEIDER